MSRLIALYGGSFNPPTTMHLAIAKQVRDALHADETWLMVSPQNPFKEANGMLPLPDRLAMTKILIQDEPGLVATDIEKGFPSRETSATLKEIFKLYPTDRFVWVMGADNMAELHLWNDWRFIMDNVPMLILPRPGYNAAALASPAASYAGAPKIDDPLKLATINGWHLLPGEGSVISASAERDALRHGVAPTNLSPSIQQYIKQQHFTF